MDTFDIYKKFYSDKSIDELQFSLLFYKSRLELLSKEFEFFSHLMNSNIFNSTTPNLFKKFERFQKEIDNKKELIFKFLSEIGLQYNEVEFKLECDILSCDDYFLRRNYELELNVVDFLSKTSELQSEMMGFMKGHIN